MPDVWKLIGWLRSSLDELLEGVPVESPESATV
jgi:hypothetical protein